MSTQPDMSEFLLPGDFNGTMSDTMVLTPRICYERFQTLRNMLMMFDGKRNRKVPSVLLVLYYYYGWMMWQEQDSNDAMRFKKVCSALSQPGYRYQERQAGLLKDMYDKKYHCPICALRRPDGRSDRSDLSLPYCPQRLCKNLTCITNDLYNFVFPLPYWFHECIESGKFCNCPYHKSINVTMPSMDMDVENSVEPPSLHLDFDESENVDDDVGNDALSRLDNGVLESYVALLREHSNTVEVHFAGKLITMPGLANNANKLDRSLSVHIVCVAGGPHDKLLLVCDCPSQKPLYKNVMEWMKYTTRVTGGVLHERCRKHIAALKSGGYIFCEHVRALEVLQKEVAFCVSTLNRDQHVSEDDMFVIELRNTVSTSSYFSVCSKAGSCEEMLFDRAVVSRSMKANGACLLRCFRCPMKGFKSVCQHVESIRTAWSGENGNSNRGGASQLLPDLSNLVDVKPDEELLKRRILNSPSIPYHHSDFQEVIKARNWCDASKKTYVPIVPSSCGCHESLQCICGNKCSCGSNWNTDILYDEQEMVLYAGEGKFPVTAKYFLCREGTCKRQWDGIADAMFRPNAHAVVSFEFLYEVLHLLFSSKLPFNKVYGYFVYRYELKGQRPMAQTQFFEFVLTFMQSISLQDLRDRLGCCHCGGAGNTVTIADGVCLATRPAKQETVQEPLDVSEEMLDVRAPDPAFRYAIENTKSRSVLIKFLKSKSPTIYESDFTGTICELLFREILLEPTSIIDPVTGLTMFYMRSVQDCVFKNCYLQFLHDVAAEVTVHSGTMKGTHSISEALSAWLDGVDAFDVYRDNATIFSTCERYFPTLALLLSQVPVVSALPGFLVPIIRRYLEICVYYQSYFSGCSLLPERSYTVTDIQDLKAGIIMPCETPGNPLSHFRKMPRFHLPTKTAHSRPCEGTYNTKNLTKKDRQRLANGKDVKDYRKQPTCVTMHCICGFYTHAFLLPIPESVGTLFHLLFTRTDLKGVLIYDNGCHCVEYFENRHPQAFKDFFVFIDRLHAKGHVACTSGHHVESYPDFTEINSMVAEQGNSSAVKIRTQVYYMTPFRASLFLLFFMVAFNDKKKKDMLASIKKSPQYARKLLRVFKQKETLEKIYLRTPPSIPCTCDMCVALKDSPIY